MSISPRQELLDLQKKLYRHNKDIINSSIVVKEPAFDAYEARYKKEVSKYQKIVSHDEMLQDILKADII